MLAAFYLDARQSVQRERYVVQRVPPKTPSSRVTHSRALWLDIDPVFDKCPVSPFGGTFCNFWYQPRYSPNICTDVAGEQRIHENLERNVREKCEGESEKSKRESRRGRGKPFLPSRLLVLLDESSKTGVNVMVCRESSPIIRSTPVASSSLSRRRNGGRTAVPTFVFAQTCLRDFIALSHLLLTCLPKVCERRNSALRTRYATRSIHFLGKFL